MVYGIDAIGPLDLVLMPFVQNLSAEANQSVEEIKNMHERVRDIIEKINATF